MDGNDLRNSRKERSLSGPGTWWAPRGLQSLTIHTAGAGAARRRESSGAEL